MNAQEKAKLIERETNTFLPDEQFGQLDLSGSPDFKQIPKEGFGTDKHGLNRVVESGANGLRALADNPTKKPFSESPKRLGTPISPNASRTRPRVRLPKSSFAHIVPTMFARTTTQTSDSGSMIANFHSLWRISISPSRPLPGRASWRPNPAPPRRSRTTKRWPLSIYVSLDNWKRLLPSFLHFHCRELSGDGAIQTNL